MCNVFRAFFRFVKESANVSVLVYGLDDIWTDGYFVNTVSQHGNEEIIAKYVRSQGEEYKQLHKTEEIEQLSLF